MSCPVLMAGSISLIFRANHGKCPCSLSMSVSQCGRCSIIQGGNLCLRGDRVRTFDCMMSRKNRDSLQSTVIAMIMILIRFDGDSMAMCLCRAVNAEIYDYMMAAPWRLSIHCVPLTVGRMWRRFGSIPIVNIYCPRGMHYAYTTSMCFDVFLRRWILCNLDTMTWFDWLIWGWAGSVSNICSAGIGWMWLVTRFTRSSFKRVWPTMMSTWWRIPMWRIVCLCMIPIQDIASPTSRITRRIVRIRLIILRVLQQSRHLCARRAMTLKIDFMLQSKGSLQRMSCRCTWRKRVRSVIAV